MDSHRQALLETRRCVAERLARVRRQRCAKSTFTARFRRYAAGDKVLLSNLARKKGMSPKLSPRWLGPYKITQVVSQALYRIQVSPLRHDRLKPYEERPSHLQPEQCNQKHRSSISSQISHEGTSVHDTDMCSSDDSDEDETDDEQGKPFTFST